MPEPSHQHRSSSLLTGRLASTDKLGLGVASTVARGLGAEASLVRISFALLSIAAGWGVVLYLLLFLLLHSRGIDARPVTLRHNLGVIVATAAQLSLAASIVDGVPIGLLWPALLITSALALSSAMTSSSTREVDLGKAAAGVLLMGAGMVSALAGTNDLSSLWYTGAAVLVLVGGLSLVLAPWYTRIVADSEADRRERIRAEERAAVAAHLHDSVLQTLTLIQNRAAEPEIAAALAHQQERELRRWLYQSAEDDPTASPSFRQLLEDEAARIEDQYLKIIECIVVGNRDVTPELQSVVSAAGEAMVNAAKFAEIPMISVFAEVRESSVLVFVRDRGIGFELAAVPADRYGLSESIQGRIERLGGNVAIKTAVGQGTEVRIEVAI